MIILPVRLHDGNLKIMVITGISVGSLFESFFRIANPDNRCSWIANPAELVVDAQDEKIRTALIFHIVHLARFFLDNVVKGPYFILVEGEVGIFG